MRKMTTYKGVDLLVPQRGEKHPNAGRPKGSKNVMTRALKDAILHAAAESKHAKANGGGLEGYLIHVANERPDLFVRLLAKLLVLQEKERARTENRFRAAPIAQHILHQVDEGTQSSKGTQSSNVIDGPFKKARPRRYRR
jgi:hypothetical protein